MAGVAEHVLEIVGGADACMHTKRARSTRGRNLHCHASRVVADTTLRTPTYCNQNRQIKVKQTADEH